MKLLFLNFVIAASIILPVASVSQAVNYAVPEPTFAIKQPTSTVCWATAATMLMSWQAKQQLSIKDVTAQADPKFATMFQSDQGLSSSDKAAFLGGLGLTAEPPASYSAQALESDLKRWGPLWVTTNEGNNKNFSIHARVLLSIMGDGSGTGTTLLLADPADGTTHAETLAAFTSKLESVARADYGGAADVRPLIVHL